MRASETPSGGASFVYRHMRTGISVFRDYDIDGILTTSYSDELGILRLDSLDAYETEADGKLLRLSDIRLEGDPEGGATRVFGTDRSGANFVLEYRLGHLGPTISFVRDDRSVAATEKPKQAIQTIEDSIQLVCI